MENTLIPNYNISYLYAHEDLMSAKTLGASSKVGQSYFSKYFQANT